jgi:hypothetical protein
VVGCLHIQGSVIALRLFCWKGRQSNSLILMARLLFVRKPFRILFFFYKAKVLARETLVESGGRIPLCVRVIRSFLLPLEERCDETWHRTRLVITLTREQLGLAWRVAVRTELVLAFVHLFFVRTTIFREFSSSKPLIKKLENRIFVDSWLQGEL